MATAKATLCLGTPGRSAQPAGTQGKVAAFLRFEPRDCARCSPLSICTTRGVRMSGAMPTVDQGAPTQQPPPHSSSLTALQEASFLPWETGGVGAARPQSSPLRKGPCLSCPQHIIPFRETEFLPHLLFSSGKLPPAHGDNSRARQSSPNNLVQVFYVQLGSI